MSFDSFEHMLWWVFAGSKGGKTRVMIVNALVEKPMNAHQLATALSLNYRTVLHHMDILEENRVVRGEGPKYGRMYFPTTLLTDNIQIYRKITSLNVRGERS